MGRIIRLLFVGAAWFPGSSLTAQAVDESAATLEVIVIDSLTGAPIPRIVLWNTRSYPAYDRMYAQQEPVTGIVRMVGVPVGQRQHFQVQCAGARLRGRLLDSISFTLAPNETRRWVVRTNGEGCDYRPFRDQSGTFEGMWRWGFEASAFTFCEPGLPTAWARLAKDAITPPDDAWPAPSNPYTREVFVRAEGRLIGPWSYGHMNGADYEFTITRILEVRKASGAQCGR